MSKDGLQRVLDFLGLLNETGTAYRIDQNSPDAITISLALVGIRAEVDFTVDGMQYSVFRGDESVHVAEQPLIELIRKLSQ